MLTHLHSFARSFSPSATDVALFDALAKAPDAAKFPNVARFYNHVASFSAEQRKKFAAALGAGAAGAGAAPAKKAAAKDEDDDVDLFGEDGDAAAASVKVAAPKKEEAVKAKKPKPTAKTICVYDVKPLEAETEPAALEAAVRSIQMDGLSWGETFRVEEIGYGIRKLVVQCVVEDEKVSLDDLEEKLNAFEDLIQSIDQLSMNKIT